MARTGTDHRGWNRQWRRAKKGIIIINHHHQHHHHRVKASSLGGKNFRVWKWTSKTTKRLVDRAANEPKAGCFSNFINFFCTLGLISSGSFCTISLVFCFACLFFFRFCFVPSPFVDYPQRWRFDENLHLLKRLCAFGKGADGLVTQNNIKIETGWVRNQQPMLALVFCISVLSLSLSPSPSHSQCAIAYFRCDVSIYFTVSAFCTVSVYRLWVFYGVVVCSYQYSTRCWSCCVI